MLTDAQKADIRAIWSKYHLRFMRDGSVEGRRLGGQWSVLYSKEDTKAHLESRGLLASQSVSKKG